ncbi:Pho23p Ecym_5350 [Eremothecium cymbalariae DBVPG|uniref:Chromatin modification-related protein n=1 Tax=Eremothecium cymbalariae (strain CBS 270.75 / DBVPG 7215 / KCTC 17166 / NRRL Y-17582) TaxID=931890 RepID=I6NDG7_ERECY|nr:hypothetical protein Ecym_5350 [Eremothecium cymbalariae DBVPG\
MSTPANLYPGLNDISDVIGEFPMEVARYMTLLREIDAKCVNTVPELNSQIGKFLAEESAGTAKTQLQTINQLFQDLMPSLEEKMHVSSIAFESLDRLVTRIELAYEVALKNQEIPEKLRLGNDNHPAMHVHHELLKKVESKQQSKSQQALRSESRREAMAAKKQQNVEGSGSGSGSGPISANTSGGGYGTNNASSFLTDPPTIAQTNANPVVSVSSPNASSVSSRRRNHNEPTTNNVVPNNNANTTRKRKRQTKEDYFQRPKTNEYGEALYCYCNQVAYGEMVGCDGENCQLEWFHLSCINLETLPKGKWYCDDCKR